VMLNAASTLHPFGNIPRYDGERFIRPADDGKAFTGEIIAYEKLAAWQDRVTYFANDQLTPSTVVQVAPVVSIFREYRYFVVGGRVVTGSLYQEDNKFTRKPLTANDAPVTTFAQSVIDRWSPGRVCVVDVAVLNGSHDLKVIEFNNANASGLYAIDKRAYVDAVNAEMAA
jgi:hypothetical protein